MRALLLVPFLVAVSVTAQTPGDCTPGTATARLNAGGVDAGLYNNGNLFFGPEGGADYTVAGGQGLYAANLWVGGTVGGEVRTAAATFHRFEFRPGPLDAGATLPAEGCAAYDRIYIVTTADVAAYEATGTATPDLAAWPVGLGAEAVTASGQPVAPASRSQVIDLAGGERPVIYGSQTAFWVMNDVGAPHEHTGSAPLGVEVQATAAAFSGFGQALDQSTLYRFRVINRSANVIEGARVSLFVDTDLGQIYQDEYQGTDVDRGMAFTYNTSSTDPQFGVPPAMGYDFLRTGLGAHRYAVNGTLYPFNDPQTAQDVYNTQQGLWSDATPQTASGDGYGDGGEATPFVYPADPVTEQFWSEENNDGNGSNNVPSNRRSMPSTPSFTLAPGAHEDVVIALVFGQGTDRLDSITQLRAASDAVQAAYDAGSLFPVDAETGAPSPVEALALSSPRPNPTTGAAEVTLALAEASAVRVTVVDALGRVVAVVHDGPLAAGAQRIALPSGLPAGVYAIVAEAAAGRATTRISVVR